MSSSVINIPSFNYGAFYYAQIYEALIARKRQTNPELTDESEFEPFMQLLSGIACVGHLNNTLLDQVANEYTLPTSQLPETVRNMLRLIDYELSSALPAITDLVYELNKVFITTSEIVPVNARAATRSEGGDAPIYFECLAGLTTTRTDQFTSVQSSDGGSFTDYTTEANAGSDFTPWSTPAAGDCLYFGHSGVMWNTLNIDVVSASNMTSIWEFYDGDLYKIQPTSVTDIGGGSLQFDLTSLLGTSNREGTLVRISLNETGAYQDVYSTYSSSTNIATTNLLGQTSPSTDAEDYSTGSEWKEFAQDDELNFTDGTLGLTTDGDVEFTLPQSETNNWQKTTINSIEAFWIRRRIIVPGGTPTSPTLNRCRMDTGKQYAISSVTQGQTVNDDPLGSSDETANQEFTITRDYFINESETLTVDSEEWTRVNNFLASGSQDKHYRIELGENEKATFLFGNGVNGLIPPLGVGNISVEYRYNAEEDGNIGSNSLVVDKSGLRYVNSIYNPRAATGWQIAEGSTDESIARAKIAGPASIRTREVALNGDQAVYLALNFTASDGTRPFARAGYKEEGFGPKTLELIVASAGGVIPSVAHRTELQNYFNGDKTVYPIIEKHYVANNEVYVSSFTPRVINLTATVTAPEAITSAAIVNQLNRIIQPAAFKSDGVTYEWDFGDTIPLSRLVHEIFDIDSRIEEVVITYPTANIVLGVRELPVSGTFTITMQQSS